MKKIITYIALAGLAAMATSCMQLKSITISKRHYRNGFYVNAPHAEHNNSSPFSISKQKHTALSNEPGLVLNKTQPVVNLENSTNYPSEKKPTQFLNSFSKELSPLPILQWKSPLMNIAPRSHFMFKGQPMHDDDHAGYVLWTIVAILLVIWLISLLTGGWGLGGLIYIFLVVALVLLLLRLLSVL